MLVLVVSILVAVLALGAIGLAGVLVARRWWEQVPAIDAAAGLLAIGLGGLVTFVAFWLHPVAGVAAGIGLLGVSVIAIILGRGWRLLPGAVPWLLLAAGILAFDIGLLALRSTTATDFALVGEVMRGLTGTPDNQLPVLVAQRLADGETTRHVLENWNGSDRPPLMAGLILLVGSPLGIATSHVPAVLALGTGIVAQLFWIPALGMFLRALGSSRRSTALTLLFVAATGSTIVNTVYTWPKMLSAALILAAGAVLVDLIRRRPDPVKHLAVAVALAVLGALAHGAALFTLPFLVTLALVALHRVPRPTALRAAAASSAVAVVLATPWVLYQRLADPPGDRLLKWHLAGVIDEDPRSFLEALVDSYRAVTPSEWLAGRLENLAVTFDPTPLRVPWCLCADVIVNRRQVEFFTTMGSLSLALPVLLAVLVAIAVRGIRRRRLDHADRVVIGVVAIAVACLVFWSLAIFLPGTTSPHLGSHLWVLLLSAVGVAWLARRHPRVVIALVMVQAAASVVLYGPLEGGIAPAGAGLLALAVGLAVTALWALRRPRPALPAAVIPR